MPLAALDELLDLAPCGFLSFDEGGRVLLVNRTLVEMLGTRKEAVLGGHIERLLTVGSRIFYQTHWFPLLRMHGSAEEIYLEFRGTGNERVGSLVNARTREGPEGRVFDCTVMRVRERQKYENELLRARESADEARRAAEEARQIAQEQQAETDAANEELQAQAMELESQQQQLQEQSAVLEATNAQLEAVNRELTERSREAERLRDIADEANQAKSRFLAVMSHELRTPLNAISGYVDVLDMEIHGPLTDRQRAAIARIRTAGLHLLRLINEVLNLARIEAGMVEYTFEAVEAGDLVNLVRPMIEPQLTIRELDFSVSGDLERRVLVDSEKAQQIVLNLLSNAAKFTQPRGSVWVEVRPAPDREGFLLIQVRDTGIGIPADKLESIFNPFVQVDASSTRETEGSGLGLAISRDLASGMNGDILVSSELGRGSTFTLVLPLA